MTLLAAAILGYVALQMAIGVAIARNVRGEDDFFLAGRRLGTGAVAASVFATWFGAETCLSAASQVRSDGLGALSVEPFGFGACLLLFGWLLAAPLWRRRLTTIADLLRERYGVVPERIAAVATIPTSILWAAAQVRAFGEILAAAAGIEVGTAIAAAALLAIAYTSLGGLLADVVTDVIQGAVLSLGLVALLWAGIAEAGGPAAFASAALGALAAAPAGGAAANPLGSPGALETFEAWALVVIGSLVAQEVVSRTLAARSEEVARRGALLGGGLYLAIGSIPVALALTAPAGIASEGDGFLPALAASVLPLALQVVFIGALVSAILSTVDSALLAASAIAVRNLLPHDSLRPLARLRAARAGVVIGGLAAFGLARAAGSIFELIEASSGFASAGVVVATFGALFTKVGRAWAGAAAITGGALAWVGFAYAWDGFPAPFLASLAVAAAGFAVGAAIDARRAEPTRA